MKKTIKYILAITAILVIGYNSMYFKKLDEVQQAASGNKFDAAAYASNFYHHLLLPKLDNAVDVSTLFNVLQTEPAKAFANYSHALGIGNIKYFLVKGKGTVTEITENNIGIAADSLQKELRMTTEFVYGNAIRDASGLVDLNAFTNTADFNNVSAEINRIIRKEVLPPFRAKVKKGDTIRFYAAMELNQAHLKPGLPELVPVAVTLAQ